MGNIIHLNEKEVKRELGELVRSTVEETLNTLLDEEADRITNARRYERTEERLDTRAGHYKRKLQTRSGEVELRVPKLRTLPFETSIIERYRRRGVIGRGSAGGDVFSGCIGTPSRGHHGSAMGDAGIAWDGQPAEQEGIRANRRMARTVH